MSFCCCTELVSWYNRTMETKTTSDADMERIALKILASNGPLTVLDASSKGPDVVKAFNRLVRRKSVKFNGTHGTYTF